jgi:prepilin-type N-terminal cleavage/methylation domain-containing protein
MRIRPTLPSGRADRGFTLIELMITLTVLAAVMVVLMTVMYAAQRSKTATSNRIESVQGARIALDMLTRDLRSAGYGADLDYAAAPQPPIAYIDSLQVLINANLSPWPDALPDQIMGGPQAYGPAGWPRPQPLNGTAWQPPIKYRHGAETIRWTMDVNNDGKPDSLDWTDADGLDAQRTPNRNDYVLVREIYGDSMGNVAGFNYGLTERVALVQRPGTAGAPAMFNVYLDGNIKWDWSAGPVPPGDLRRISRVEVNITAGSSRPDNKGQFATTMLTTEVSSMRNVPNFGVTTFDVYGYVFNDNLYKNGTKDPGEAGVPGALVSCGVQSVATDVNGYFIIKKPAGTYVLRHTPPASFGVATNPDSFVVTVGPAQTRSFADTAIAGGYVTSFTYHDVNGNLSWDAGTDSVLALTRVTVTPGPDVQYTDNYGYVTNFARSGTYTVAATAPDSMTATSPNPITSTMTAGGTASYSFAFRKVGKGTVKGKVFLDNNRNGVLNIGELGIEGVWVGITPDAGSTVLGWQNTDASGNYSIVVPEVQSPSPPYYAMIIVKPGYFPTSTTSVGPFYLLTGEIRLNNNFGMANYQIIRLTASRVLSLASTDLIEGDWNGSHTENAHGDTDLILGADATGSDQISTWFNQYDNASIFNPDPTRSYTAQSSVLSIAADTLDNTSSWRVRPDLATGTKNASGGNFFVWLNQNSNNNEGYLPSSASLAYRTQDMGDVQAILSYQCAGGGMPDLIVGTKSPTANQGTIEVWQNNDASAVAFTRVEVYPPNGLIPLNNLGEVTAMALADLDGDGNKDLVVGTHTGSYSGQLLVFKHVSDVDGTRFVYQWGQDLGGEAVTTLTCFDVNGDGLQDIVVGVQTGLSTGRVQQWNNYFDGVTWKFAKDYENNAPGIPQTMVSADFGGSAKVDLAMGYRADMNNYLGGVRVYFCETDRVPTVGSDPSGGSVTNMVPAATTGNYNYGVYPVKAAGPYLTDLATGVKITSSTGALVVYIR